MKKTILNLKTRLKLISYISLILLTFPIIAASQEKKMSIVRDEETEKLLLEITEEVLSASGIEPSSVEIILVNDPSINAFVAGGQKLFIHTGLLVQADDVSAVIGVIAHEVGHIKGAHLVQKQGVGEATSVGSIASYVLGLGSVLAGAPPEAGIAISSAGQSMAIRNMLSYSRSYENSADTVAISVLEKMGVTPKGLIGLLNKLLKQQKISGDIRDKYMLTHPISEDRINYLQSSIDANPGKFREAKLDWRKRFYRIKAKIYGFLYKVEYATKLYGASNTDDKKYAMSIVHHRMGNNEKSSELLNSLIAANPSDAFYAELKAQFAFERGNFDEAISGYKKALNLAGGTANLFRYKIAESYTSKGDSASLNSAISELKAILLTEPRNAAAIKMLGIVYGKLGDLPKSYLYLAESAIVVKDKENARFYLAKTQSLVDKKSQEFFRFSELKRELDRMLAE